MAIYRGFVQSVLVRADGWVETVIEAVHAGNGTQAFFIPNLDGDLTQAHKRLAQVSLLRDALARVEPVELDYNSDLQQGNLIQDVTIFERVSIDGRRGTNLITGTVIGISITERGPESGTTPYRDEADFASITLLHDDGTVEALVLDLQRPDPGTAQAELAMLQRAHRTRRPVELMVSQDFQSSVGTDRQKMNVAAATTGGGGAVAWIQTCRWVTIPQTDLQYVYAFLERLGQRYESYTSSSAPAAWYVEVTYTTAPGQTPEGDMSDNGTFTPQRLTAWVHSDSPLLVRLEAALRDSLQVRLGLAGDRIHEVELVAGLGSTARPIWIVTETSPGKCEQDGASCVNVPTVSGPSTSALNSLPHSVVWCAEAYFREGIWRFVVSAPAAFKLLIDSKEICCGTSLAQQHAYLKDVHHVRLELAGYTCLSTFQLKCYRIR
jgi:hypothetical protein